MFNPSYPKELHEYFEWRDQLEERAQDPELKKQTPYLSSYEEIDRGSFYERIPKRKIFSYASIIGEEKEDEVAYLFLTEDGSQEEQVVQALGDKSQALSDKREKSMIAHKQNAMMRGEVVRSFRERRKKEAIGEDIAMKKSELDNTIITQQSLSIVEREKIIDLQYIKKNTVTSCQSESPVSLRPKRLRDCNKTLYEHRLISFQGALFILLLRREGSSNPINQEKDKINRYRVLSQYCLNKRVEKSCTKVTYRGVEKSCTKVTDIDLMICYHPPPPLLCMHEEKRVASVGRI